MGATIILKEDRQLISCREFGRSLLKEQLTILNLPTAYWHQWVSELFTYKESLPSCVRLVIVGGERISPQTLRQWQTFSTSLVHAYGLTETTVTSTVYRLASHTELLESKELPIGKPIANTQIYLLDSHLQPVPVGVTGEIYIGGDKIARGYLNRPDLTAARFIANPFSEVAGSRLYRTGDMARYLPDGNLEFLGRLDRQVKLRGFRIELGEIETRLEEHPQVKQAVVQVKQDSLNRQRLVAYLVCDRISPTSNELRSYLKAKLPDYTIPSIFVLLDALPLTPNGKIDREALLAKEVTTTEREEVVTARNSVEETLVKIWTDVLPVNNVGVYDNFFELGGDSIVSLQVIAKAKDAGLQLTPKQIFAYQTIAELATVATKTATLKAEQGLVTGTLPLNPIQHHFFEQKFAEPHHWNQSAMLEVRDCDPLQSARALQYLWEYHDVLRSRFVETESGWHSIIEGLQQNLPFSVINLSELHPKKQKKTIEAIASKLQASLSLTEGQLMRVVCFDLGEKQPSRLLMIVHHLIIDGVSWRILLEDLETIYRQLTQQQTIQLPAKTTSYKQWAEELQKYAQSIGGKKELTYWLERLECTKNYLHTLPKDFRKGDNTIASAATISVTLSEKETHSLLQEIPSTYQTQINDVLLTALVQAFGQWTGNDFILIELEGHGREDIFKNIDLSRTVGWFTSFFPVILNLRKNGQPGEALKTLKEQLRSIPDRGFNYGLLYYLNNDPSIRKKLQQFPQVEVRFNYLGRFDRVISDSIFQPAKESTGLNQSPKGHRDCLLEINGAIALNRLRLDWSYSKTMYRETTIQKLADSYIEKLRSLIAHCQAPDAGGYTPSDFAEFQQSQWSDRDLEDITAVIRGM
jgi:non-ribosomal peptide synthase protein (TIGR01720 family)